MLSIVGSERCSVFLLPAKTSISSFPTPKNLSIPKKPSLSISCNNSSSATQIGNEKMKVVVKAMERPRLVLKFIWMEKNIGIAVDQLIPGGHGTIPVSPYYFWPRKDAWEELKLLIETKPWISNKQKVILLNQATDIINLWQNNPHP